jgi:hypothetical protein
MAVLGFGSRVVAQQDCSVFMKYGIYDRSNTLSVKNHFKQVQDFFAQNNFHSLQEAENGGLKAGINVLDIVSLDFANHNASSEWDQWQDSFLKTDFNVEQTDSRYVNAVEKISGEITKIIEQCLINNRGGFFRWIEPASDHLTFTFSARYIDSTSASNTTKILSFDLLPRYLSNTCGQAALPLFQKGQTLTGAGLSVTCKRNRPEDVVVITMNVDRGGDSNAHAVTLDEYTPPLPVKPRSNRDKCIDGDDDACSQYVTEITASCNGLPSSTPPDDRLQCLQKAQCWSNVPLSRKAVTWACMTWVVGSAFHREQDKRVLLHSS